MTFDGLAFELLSKFQTVDYCVEREPGVSLLGPRGFSASAQFLAICTLLHTTATLSKTTWRGPFPNHWGHFGSWNTCTWIWTDYKTGATSESIYEAPLEFSYIFLPLEDTRTKRLDRTPQPFFFLWAVSPFYLLFVHTAGSLGESILGHNHG